MVGVWGRPSWAGEGVGRVDPCCQDHQLVGAQSDDLIIEIDARNLYLEHLIYMYSIFRMSVCE